VIHAGEIEELFKEEGIAEREKTFTTAMGNTYKVQINVKTDES
jgi:hypothetical protein